MAVFCFLNGVSQFTPTCGPLNSPMIVPFWADVDTRVGGIVLYRETTDSSVLAKAKSDIIAAFPFMMNIDLAWSFILTWNEVAYYGAPLAGPDCPGQNKTNTFQLALVTDGVHSFTIFYYAQLTWKTGTASDGDSCTGLGGTQAKAGFDYGDSQTFYTIEGSCTPDVINLTETSNINKPGAFVFRIDETLESGICDINRRRSARSGTIRVRSSPTFISLLGGVPIEVQDVCLSGTNTEIKCRIFDLEETLVDGVLGENNSVICPLPYLYKTGRIKILVEVQSLHLINRQELIQYETYIYTKHPDPSPPFNFTVLSEVTRNIQLQWDASQLPMATHVDANLATFDGVTWTEVGTLFQNIPNNGDFAGIPANLTIFDGIEGMFVVYLTESNEQQTKAIPLALRLFTTILIRLLPLAADVHCKSWHAADPWVPTDLEQCPPTEALAQQDHRFQRSGPLDLIWLYHPGSDVCYRQRAASPSGGGQQCCFKDGNIYIRPPAAGSVDKVSPSHSFWGHMLHDVLPWWTCCRLSQNCDLYYDKRPADDGEGYDPPELGNGNGDPHITTFDHLSYTFNGVGEFWMVKSLLPDQDFEMQARMEAFIPPGSGISSRASVFTAFALQSRETTVEVRLASSVLQVIIDGIDVDFSSNDAQTDIPLDGATVRLSSSTEVLASFQSGYSFRFSTAGETIDITASSSEANLGKTAGLLGYFDGESSNDLRDPAGSFIPSNSNLESIHNSFGLLWRTTPESPFFTYEPGKSHENYQDHGFVPTFEVPDESQLPEEVKTTCQQSFSCIFDYLSTGSKSFAERTKEQERAFNETLDIVKEKVHSCGKPEAPANGFVVADNYLVGTAASYYCNNEEEKEYILDGHNTTVCQIFQNTPGWSNPTPRCTLSKPGGAGVKIPQGFICLYVLGLIVRNI